MSAAELSVKIHNLPVLRLTTVSAHGEPGQLPVDCTTLSGRQVRYWRRPEATTVRKWKTFRRFPLVLNADGSPWAPACLWLLDRAIAKPTKVDSLRPLAQDLRTYKAFLDDLGRDWADFSQVDKYLRSTYLYKFRLDDLIRNGRVKRSTAARQLNSVLRFYRFARSESRIRFEPANEPWVERKVSMSYRDSQGFMRSKEIVTADVSIHASKSDRSRAETDDTIDDGGKLRPLPADEQRCLIRALVRLGNPEYLLMHLIALMTGAREGTLLTLRFGSFIVDPSKISQWPLKVRCGPGSHIGKCFNAFSQFLSWVDASANGSQFLDVFSDADVALSALKEHHRFGR